MVYNLNKELIEKVIPKKVTVEEIHKEFDTAQDRILDECDRVLAELNIPTESKIEKKAKMLEELGFVNSETVHQAKKFWEKNRVFQFIESIESNFA